MPDPKRVLPSSFSNTSAPQFLLVIDRRNKMKKKNKGNGPRRKWTKERHKRNRKKGWQNSEIKWWQGSKK